MYNQRKSQFEHFVQGFGNELSAQMKLQFYHDLLIERFTQSKERQRMKDEIKAEVLAEIRLEIQNEALKALEDIFKDFR